MHQASDVVLLPFPFSDLSASKQRPVLLLKRPNAQGDFVAAQITSQLRHHPQVALDAADFDLGVLPKPSIVRVDKLFTLNEVLILRRVGRLTQAAMRRIVVRICVELGCTEQGGGAAPAASILFPS
jgi:mRNA interferase MazF